MLKVRMKAYNVVELNFINKLENGTQVHFSNKYSYNVQYSNTNICKCELHAEAFDKEVPDKFGVKLVLNGIFEFNNDMKKEEVHVETFKQLFPYARSIISTVSVNAGLPPIIIPEFDIESQSIYKFEKNV